MYFPASLGSFVLTLYSFSLFSLLHWREAIKTAANSHQAFIVQLQENIFNSG